jgi:hypothetical protein
MIPHEHVGTKNVARQSFQRWPVTLRAKTGNIAQAMTGRGLSIESLRCAGSEGIVSPPGLLAPSCTVRYRTERWTGYSPQRQSVDGVMHLLVVRRIHAAIADLVPLMGRPCRSRTSAPNHAHRRGGGRRHTDAVIDTRESCCLRMGSSHYR